MQPQHFMLGGFLPLTGIFRILVTLYQTSELVHYIIIASTPLTCIVYELDKFLLLTGNRTWDRADLKQISLVFIVFPKLFIVHSSVEALQKPCSSGTVTSHPTVLRENIGWNAVRVQLLIFDHSVKVRVVIEHLSEQLHVDNHLQVPQ